MKQAMRIIAGGLIRGGSIRDHDPRNVAGQKYYQAKLKNVQRFAELILEGDIQEAAKLVTPKGARLLLNK